MKKLSSFLLAIAFVLSACGAPAPVNTPMPTFTAIPASTVTPASTETPIATETPTPPEEPYAIISSDKAEFWFPLPNKKEWEWGITTKVGGADYGWSISFGNPKDYALIVLRCGYPKPKSPQTGSFEDMLKTCGSLFRTSPAGDLVTSSDVTSSYSNGGLLIQLTDPSSLQNLIKDKPKSIFFERLQTIGVTPSKTLPSSSFSALITPDKAEFRFQLPDKTEWEWNNPLTDGSRWTIDSATDIVTQISCKTDNNKPMQTGSLADLLKTCEKSGDTSLSYPDNGFLIELTEPALLKLLNKNPEQTIFFHYPESFNVMPTYK